MFATINIHKPLGLTSHDVVSRLRRIFNLKRIGHLGTLDPLAEGVLPLCLGQATRLIEYFPSNKRYTARVTLGRTTTTLDREGDVLSEQDCSGLGVSSERLAPILAHFTGTIAQKVPLYSAVHVNGQKLYKVARRDSQEASQVELPTREVTIERLALLDLDLEDPAHPTLTLDVACSSGTYIRSLARDIGEAIGCGAYLSGLVRTEHGRFRLEESVTLDTLQTTEHPEQYLLNPVSYLELPVVQIDSETDAWRLMQGQRIEAPLSITAAESPFLAVHRERPLGVVELSGGRLKPLKIFPS